MAALNKAEWALIFDEEIWPIYPARNGTRQGKVPAQLAWGKHKTKTRKAADKIIAAIKYLKTTPDWMKENGQFVPMPATFLNATKKRWVIEFDSPVEEQVNKDINGIDEQVQVSPTEAPKQESQPKTTKAPVVAKTKKQLYLERLGYNV